MKSATIFCLVFCASMIATIAFGDERHELADGTHVTSNETIQAMHAEAQRLRVANGRHVQTLDAECCIIAQRWANHMAACGSMYHGGGEQIIAYGDSTISGCFRRWMNSGGHRAWVLGGAQLCGYGCQRSRSGQWYWAGVFRSKPVAQE